MTSYAIIGAGETGPDRLNDATQSNGNAVISFAAVIIIVIGLQMAKDLLVPFLVAVFLALIAVRPMLWMQKKRIPAVVVRLPFYDPDKTRVRA